MAGKIKSGARYKSGKRKPDKNRAIPWDYGNQRAQQRRALFDCMAIKGGKAVDQVHDGIGQLWALDFLDGHGFDDTALRDAGRTFAELWWSRYQATAPKTAQYERASRTTHAFDGRTKRDIMFDRMDDSLPCRSMERAAVIDLCVDPWFFDDIAMWANRLVTTELARRGRFAELIEIEGAQDRDMLAALIRGLCALVDAGLPARFERRAA